MPIFTKSTRSLIGVPVHLWNTNAIRSKNSTYDKTSRIISQHLHKIDASRNGRIDVLRVDAWADLFYAGTTDAAYAPRTSCILVLYCYVFVLRVYAKIEEILVGAYVGLVYAGVGG
jgi:hypothetical protein